MSHGELPRIQVFISSPGDVREERQRAVAVVNQIQRFFQGRCVLVPYVWEKEPMLASSSFQDQIDRPSQCDIAVFVLWSRLGTPLSEPFRQEDGHLPTGTEWEFLDARAERDARGSPDILVFRRQGYAPIPGNVSLEACQQLIEQRQAVSEFFARWFQNPDDGTFIAAFNPYETPDGFAGLLASHLTAIIEKRLAGGAHRATWKGSPFKGLSAFEYDDAPIFFGRARATHELVQRLCDQVKRGVGFVLVLGMSGSGKSSLVRAGLLPMLDRPDVIDPRLTSESTTRRAIMRPGAGASAFHALAGALLEPEALPSLGGPDGADALAKTLATPEAAVALIEHALRQIAPQTRLVLVVDQLEELVTTKEYTDASRECFVDVVAALARHDAVWVVATLRSDFYHHVQQFSPLVELKGKSGTYDLVAPTAAEIGEMIRHPAQVAGLQYEVEASTGMSLASHLERAATASPESLPLLQFVLEQLHRDRRGVTLTYEAFDNLGGLEGAMATRAEHVFTRLTATSQEAFRPVMRHLVEVGAEGEPTRRYADKEIIRAIPGASSFVDEFVEARLLFSDKSADGSPTVSVAHEALLRRWSRLKQWLEEDREILGARTRLESAAAQYFSSGRERSLLLSRGRPLSDARRLLASGVELSSDERAFVTASESKARARTRLKRAAISTIVILGIGAGVLAWRAGQEAHLARTAEQLAKTREQQAVAAKQEAESERRKVLRLADAKKVRDLIEAASNLWPVHPQSVERLTAWILAAESILERRVAHEAAHDELRALGRRVVSADGVPTWSFDNEENAWKHQVLTGVCEDLERLASAEGLLQRVGSRRRDAASLRERSVDAHAEAWAAARRRVSASEKYGGFELDTQLGLIPLGPDPESACEEFAHVGSGSLPTRGPTGKLEISNDAAIVLVLIPGGTFWMGAQRERPPNQDPEADKEGWEGPVHRVTLRPFLIGKFEVTQAQWAAIAEGARPSQYRAGSVYSGQTIHDAHPAEQVSWNAADRWLRRVRLQLPTEAQWEFSCRAGSTSPWSFGVATPVLLSRHVNVADLALHKRDDSMLHDSRVDDGHVMHAPVTSFPPNALGLHSMHGNVSEWVQDVFRRFYEPGPATDPVSSAGSEARTLRGGAWSSLPSGCRASWRGFWTPDHAIDSLGVRAAAALD